MANKIYVNEETGITWKSSTGTAVLTMTSLATGTGRQGAQVDRGAGAKAARYIWRLLTKLGATTTSVVLGNPISIYLCTAGTIQGTTITDGNLGTTDAALPTLDRRRNLLYLGCIECDLVAANQIYVGSGIVEIAERYLSPVIINEIGNTLSATALDHVFSLTPIPDEIQ